MPITSVTSDAATLTLTLVGDYPVTVDRLWDAWADPRQIERFWGPPTHPATFTRHDMAPGGRTEYFMTGPDGEHFPGYWRIEAVDHGRSFEIVDGFVDDDGNENDDLPTSRMRVEFEPTPAGSRFTAVTTFPSLEAMERLAEMGMVEGIRSALAQMDDVVADLASFVAGRATELHELTDTSARVSRVIRGSVEQVWHAYHDADLVRRWMLGPDGWTMPVCHVADAVGGTFRYEWASDDGGQRFGLEGEVLELDPPRRSVTTERMIGADGPPVVNELTLTPLVDGTLLSLVITYPSKELRDEIVGQGMIQGMEASYARLEHLVLTPA
jgi:uncharacterized protein YndB with AHSA1/START domain